MAEPAAATSRHGGRSIDTAAASVQELDGVRAHDGHTRAAARHTTCLRPWQPCGLSPCARLQGERLVARREASATASSWRSIDRYQIYRSIPRRHRHDALRDRCCAYSARCTTQLRLMGRSMGYAGQPPCSLPPPCSCWAALTLACAAPLESFEVGCIVR